MLHLTLSKADFIVEEATDAHQAKPFIFNRLPELILMDWMLPGVSGIELTRQLKADSKTQ
jgi:two-component system phosphate regulon response regulator PhoB